MGVRFPIPEIYKDDIEYEIRNDTRDGVGAGSRNGNFAGITLKSMKQQPNYIKDCVPVAIFRAKEPSAHFPQADTHLGIYYYQALSGGALCYAGDPPVNEPNLLADIAQVVRLIEVIPVK